MSKLTTELVRDFADYMTAKYKAQIVDKGLAFEASLAATFLHAWGIVSHDDFLEHFATTIGHRMYLPFTPGVPKTGWSLWQQIVVITHECQHIVQYDKLGAARFMWQYVRSTAERTRLEAEAYRCQLELHYWRTGQIMPAKDLAASLKSYGVTETDLRVAERMITMAAESVKQGAILNHASRVAIEWLNTNAPELRAPKD